VIELFVKRRKLGRVYGPDFTTRLTLKHKVVRRDPDVMFVSTESMPRATRTVLNGPPELAVEVVSPDSEFRDFNQKFLEYQEAGVREYWIVNPASQQIHLFVRDEKTNGFAPRDPDAEGRYQSSVLPGIWFRGKDLFVDDRPDAVELLNRIDPSILASK
jgi:Uma2 family endonuclease